LRPPMSEFASYSGLRTGLGAGEMVVNMREAPCGVVELSESEAASLFDKIAWENLHMSGVEFLKRWDAGEYRHTDWDAVPGLAEVAMLIPFAR
jgi:hypothetical protein